MKAPAHIRIVGGLLRLARIGALLLFLRATYNLLMYSLWYANNKDAFHGTTQQLMFHIGDFILLLAAIFLLRFVINWMYIKKTGAGHPLFADKRWNF